MVRQNTRNNDCGHISSGSIPLSSARILTLSSCRQADPDSHSTIPNADINSLSRSLISHAVRHTCSLAPQTVHNTASGGAGVRHLGLLSFRNGIAGTNLLTTNICPRRFCPGLFVSITIRTKARGNVTKSLEFVSHAVYRKALNRVVSSTITTITGGLQQASAIRNISHISSLRVPRRILHRTVTGTMVRQRCKSQFYKRSVTISIFSSHIRIAGPNNLCKKGAHRGLFSNDSQYHGTALIGLVSVIPLPSNTNSPTRNGNSNVPVVVSTVHTRNLTRPLFYPKFSQFGIMLCHSGVRPISRNKNLVIATLGRCNRLKAHRLTRHARLAVSRIESHIGTLVTRNRLRPATPTADHGHGCQLSRHIRWVH